MTPEEKSNLKEKLAKEIETLKKDIPGFEKLIKPIPPDNAIGRLTRMEAIQSKSIHEANLRSARQKLSRLERALTNIDDPAFGICSLCDQPIPIGRMMLMPETTTCVKCADR